MSIQQEISKKNLEKRIGQEYEVIIENISFDGKYLVGRTKMDVPEMDGVVYIKNTFGQNLKNLFIWCKIVGIKEYDLIGEIKEQK